MNEFIPQKDYNFIKFTKEQKDIVKRIKDYSDRNCRKIINKRYITSCLTNFDYGFAYFRTEILKVDNSIKNRPCAFACIRKEYDGILFLQIICAIQNMDKLGTRLLNDIFEFAIKNNYIQIILESNQQNKSFYEKYNFKESGMTDENLYIMAKFF